MEEKHHHEGYEYQDCLCAYFILREILNDKDSKIAIDVKESESDKFDDLTIINEVGRSKKQIKYSNLNTDKTLQKNDISTASYDLAIDVLFDSWLKNKADNLIDFRLCLSWNEPIDELTEILVEDKFSQTSFTNSSTKILKIDIDKLWAEDQEPHSSWRRFRKKAENINRDLFKEFTEQFIIEVSFPKFSLDIYSPGELEKILFDQVIRLGIGEYPNDNLESDKTILQLFHLIKRCRVTGETISLKSIVHYLGIRCDYGSILQEFPVDASVNVIPERILKEIERFLNDNNLGILFGEPGSGKSWAIENLVRKFREEGKKIIRHLCFISLEDDFMISRIKTNTFYGNLINDILLQYPDLKETKKAIYASNLSELNNLLDNITEETFLIIDGLDHIGRIYEYASSELNLAQIDIIDKIKKLRLNNNIKCLVISQPLHELKELPGYEIHNLPSWQEDEVIQLLTRNNIENTQIGESSLSELLEYKSQGNPLYLTYLIKEIKNDINIKYNLDEMPRYSYNLATYYEYLLNKVDLRDEIPRILAGANFRLTKNEIIEITDLGVYVEKSLEILFPLLNYKYANYGYIIYHESFRRFMMEDLREKKVSLTRNVYKPLVEWFEKKGFFEFNKAFRHCLAILLLIEEYDQVLSLLSYNFVTRSIENGHSWELIEKNYRYFLKAAVKTNDFPSIVLLNEINRIISSTENEYENLFNTYFEAFVKLNKNRSAVSILSYEGYPTLSNELGINCCYLCDLNGETPPWDLYWEYFNDNPITLDNFHIILRYNFINNTDKLIDIAQDIVANKRYDFAKIFKDELSNYGEQFIKHELNNRETIKQMYLLKKEYNSDISTAITNILSLEYIHDEHIIVIEEFFDAIEKTIGEGKTEIIAYVIDQLKSRNWFYNWLIYYIKILNYKKNESYCFSDIKDAFNYLIFDTDPFKGKPRTCDLYKAESYIHHTIKEGIQLLSNKNEWDEILTLLATVSEKTTTSLQGSLGGPLSTNDFLRMLKQNANDYNIDKIIHIYYEVIDKEKKYSFYSYIAEYYLQLSILLANSEDLTRAKKVFVYGLQNMLAYTFRKDITLEELIESIVSLSKINSGLAIEYIKKIKILAESVVNHTDGKDTRHFPVSWYNKMLEIDFNLALVYLRNELLLVRYDWRLEESLVDLLTKSRGKINPLIELLIANTFLGNNSEDYLDVYIDLIKMNTNDITNLSRIATSSLLEKYLIDKGENNYSHAFQDKLFTFLLETKITTNNVLNKPKSENLSQNLTKQYDYQKIIEERVLSRTPFGQMSYEDIIVYFSKGSISDSDINALIYYFDNNNVLTDKIKKIIQKLVTLDKWSSNSNKNRFDIIFKENPFLNNYYLVCRFIFDLGGWYESLVNIEAFIEAYKISKENTVEHVFELLNEKLSEISFHRSIPANLINSLVSVGFCRETIIEMWSSLYKIIDYRLPSKIDYDWSEIEDDGKDMTQEELILCVLFTRLRSNSVLRFNYTVSGLAILFKDHSQMLIKPLKWFFKNFDHFLEIVQIVVLQLISDHNVDKNELKTDLDRIYPTDNFILDYLIELILQKSKRERIFRSPKLINTIQDQGYEFYWQLNVRHRILAEQGYSIESIFGEFHNTFRKKHQKLLELYYNRAYKSSARSLYASNYLLKLLNENLYDEFRIQSPENEQKLFHINRIDYKTLLAQHNSNYSRPNNLPKPSEFEENINHMSVQYAKDDWVRLGHIEIELVEENYSSGFNKIKSFSGIIIDDSLSKHNFPFVNYPLNPFYIWNPMSCNYKNDDKLVFSFLQLGELFEYYKVLWINPCLITMLNLTVLDYYNGLSAKNEEGNIVLKYNSWQTNYVGNRGLDDEIPQLDGCELIIREDYYKKILALYSKEPKYLCIKI